MARYKKRTYVMRSHMLPRRVTSTATTNRVMSSRDCLMRAEYLFCRHGARPRAAGCLSPDAELRAAAAIFALRLRITVDRRVTSPRRYSFAMRMMF